MTASGPFSDRAPDAKQVSASESDEVKQIFPHPITPRGIAAYTTACRGSYLSTITVFAILSAISICIMIDRCLVQPINIAIERLPEKGAVSGGKLEWFTNETIILIETRSLSIHVNPTDEEPIADGSDLQIIFARDRFLLRSLLGWLVIPYPKSLYLPLNLKELWTTWGAYKSAIIPSAFLLSIAFLCLTWLGLAWLYTIPVSLMVKILKRDVTAIGVFRISVMSQMLPAAVMSTGIILYSYNRFDLTTLFIIFAAHIIFTWIYLIITPFYLNRHPEVLKNPFSNSSETTGFKQE